MRLVCNRCHHVFRDEDGHNCGERRSFVEENRNVYDRSARVDNGLRDRFGERSTREADAYVEGYKSAYEKVRKEMDKERIDKERLQRAPRELDEFVERRENDYDEWVWEETTRERTERLELEREWEREKERREIEAERDWRDLKRWEEEEKVDVERDWWETRKHRR